jgi:Flp pilus assembly protein CpaB
LEDKDRKEEERKVDQANLNLESAATQDVQQYLEDCRQRRRMSLALRAKEKRHHAHWQEREAERRRQQQSRDTRDRALDHRHMEMARQKERARIAMDAIRHAHCTFAINPFAGLLDN